LGRRLAVLEELGYVEGWGLTDPGVRLAGVYHESDLLLAELINERLLATSEPSVLAGVLSAMVFEKRRARRSFGPAAHRGTGAPARSPRRSASSNDRLGERRRTDLAVRLADVAERAERIRAVEEVYTVPRTRQPEPGVARAVAAWVRGAPFGAVLDVAAHDVGEIAPGDFVRTVKQVADLAEQVATVAGDPATAAAAAEAARLLVRDVVAAGGLTASNTETVGRT
jgi:ATP-dependent RNA helicase HelY